MTKPASDSPAVNVDPFTFTGKDGVEHQIPSFATVPAGVLRRIRKQDEASQMFECLEWACRDNPLALAAADELTGPEIAVVFTDWQTAAGADLPS